MDSSVDAVIIGMGYVGLPLAREASAAGLSVIGLDINSEVIDGLNHGRSHVDDLADSDVAEMLDRGFEAAEWSHQATTTDGITCSFASGRLRDRDSASRLALQCTSSTRSDSHGF